ncbi:unnamed protein product, partial [Allacma fusca]
MPCSCCRCSLRQNKLGIIPNYWETNINIRRLPRAFLEVATSP